MDIQLLPVAPSASGTALPLAPAETLPAVAAAQAEGTPEPFTLQALHQALNDAIQSRSTALEFSIDETTKQQVVVVRDADSGDVIFQCPSEEALRMIRNLKAGVGGLVDKLV